ncbi:DUF29 domain-containing protein [Paraburkholderia jirisanensis]
MGTKYDDDICLWTFEQAALVRDGKFDQLDSEHVADEIESVARTEQRLFAAGIASVMTLMARIRYKPDEPASTARELKHARYKVDCMIRDTPSLAGRLTDIKRVERIWGDALVEAFKHGLVIEQMSETCPWTMEQVLSDDFHPI